ncbi:hypothetical protein F5144DRAFT_233166 [Chaetomium tenue]|uniref:Uncharacterized protein n=1 Tax=Chaetomium tenue TaxID=1854479 RepID=A0ACB7PBB0_9PEZI|nr:hypothetical protein F5144DRAFT_233166 [Chaetomium globosum]
MPPTAPKNQPRGAPPATPAIDPNHIAHALIIPRQNPQDNPPPPPTHTTTIPAYYGSLTGGPDPGAVAGITLGAVAGFVLLLWLVYTCINIGNPGAVGSGVGDTSTVVTEGSGSVYTRRKQRSRSRRRSSRHRHQHKETVEVRRGGVTVRGGPVVVEEVVSSSMAPSEFDRVVVQEERRRRSVSRARMAGAGPPPPRRVVSSSGEDDEDDEDEVVVIEEHSPSRRRRSRVRSVERRSSGFREVDPDRFAGGDAAFVGVRRSGSRR